MLAKSKVFQGVVSSRCSLCQYRLGSLHFCLQVCLHCAFFLCEIARCYVSNFVVYFTQVRDVQSLQKGRYILIWNLLQLYLQSFCACLLSLSLRDNRTTGCGFSVRLEGRLKGTHLLNVVLLLIECHFEYVSIFPFHIKFILFLSELRF